MPKDIRDILKDAKHNQLNLPENHRIRFEDRLERLHTPKKKNYFFLKIAASITLLVSLGYFALNTNTTAPQVEDIPEFRITSLSSISPEMKQIENYYLAAINYEIASLEIIPENQEILDDYLEKIGKLTDDYQRLNKEILDKGISEKIINALITNLQLRLQLLVQLKDTLSEIKTSKNKENENTTV